ELWSRLHPSNSSCRLKGFALSNRMPKSLQFLNLASWKLVCSILDKDRLHSVKIQSINLTSFKFSPSKLHCSNRQYSYSALAKGCSWKLMFLKVWSSKYSMLIKNV